MERYLMMVYTGIYSSLVSNMKIKTEIYRLLTLLEEIKPNGRSNCRRPKPEQNTLKKPNLVKLLKFKVLHIN